ncbi:MAG: Molybdopterin molybdenumtransferase [Pseudomonadota bacterium]
MTHPPSLADIAAQLEAYDPQALPANEVLNFLDHLVTPVHDSESVDIFAALGRVTAQDVISTLNVPPHDNSAMDGFAFDGAQLRDAQSLSLKVVGTALAGKAWAGTVNAGECVKIMTGAIMPEGLNTVVPQELCQITASETIEIPAGLLKSGDNRRLCGEDIMQGHAALLKGALITPAAAGLLASLGVPNVLVVRRLRVAYFSTGDEILSLGEAPREGAVYDSNRYTVHGMLQALGCEMIDMGVVKDIPELLEQAFNKAAEQADAIITSGGVSVGEADFTKAMMKKLGDVVFVELPEVGSSFEQKAVAGVVESVKAAADVYMPISGEITEVNEALRADPALANTDPLGAGWFFKVKLTDTSQVDALLDETAYSAFAASH